MADITPVTREEYYLAKAGGQDVPVPSAVTREEHYLEKLSNDSVVVPSPVTRREKFLYFACGGEIDLPSEERMTRLERLIAKAGGMDVATPTAVTRLEKFWSNVEGGGWKVTELTGTLPMTFRSNGTALIDYRIYGTAEGAGVQTENQYTIPLTVTNGTESKTAVIYIGDSKLLAEEYVDSATEKIYKWADITGLNEPLCGIDTYTDSLDLSTGTLTRRIKKLVLTGEESWGTYSVLDSSYCAFLSLQNFRGADVSSDIAPIICSHYICRSQNFIYNGMYKTSCGGRTNQGLLFRDENITTAADFKAYLAAQYAAGTPVTIWYVLAEPEVSTIPVPSGLSGTIEGYLIQDGTPTPENPIYPTANGVKQTDGTYTIESAYINPTDPPTPLPPIETFNGTNTLDSTETLGEVTIKGRIKEA